MQNLKGKTAITSYVISFLCFVGMLFCLAFISYTQDDSKVDFKFSTVACDKNTNGLDAYSPPQEGILKENWTGADKLAVECFVKTFCAGAIIKGDYEITNNFLILKYKIETSGPVTQCNCTHKAVYEFSNLAKKQYEISIQREQAK